MLTRVDKGLERRGGDDFLDEEFDMANILDELMAGTSARTIKIFETAMKGRGINLDTLEEGVAQARPVYNNIFVGAETSVGAVIARSIDKGVLTTPARADILRGAPTVISVEQGILASTKYYTNAYFNERVVPDLFQRVTATLESGATPRFDDIAAAIGKRLESVPYWRTVANAAASRGYHYGVLKAGQFTGFKRYMFVAVQDERTSTICKDLDGQVWDIQVAARHVERLAAADPTEVKELAPWLQSSEIREMSNSELADAGVLLPPRHGNCRSTIALL